MRYTTPTHTQFIGQRLIHEAFCASTNSLAGQYLARKTLPEGTVAITDHQYQGRGQRGNTWYSEPHKNLTFSVVLYPTFLAASQNFLLNIITTLAVHQVLSTYMPKYLTIKWPNDIYYQDHKLGGILIENTVENQQLKLSVLGIGINVNQERFHIKGPTSLTRILGHTLSLQQILAQLLVSLERNYLRLKAQDITYLQDAYLKDMYRIHEVHTFKDATRIFKGTINGIDASGKLIIAQADGTLRYYNTQEVTFLS